MSLPGLHIGSLNVEHPVGLSPMAGYTDCAMRGLCRRHGAGFALTEVVNAEGIVRGSKPTMHLLETAPGENPVGAHIYGARPATMADAARAIEDLGRFDFIDLNCGCPVRKIVAKGAGAALMKDPVRLAAIAAAMVRAVSLPVTVKTRIGFSDETVNIAEVARVVEEAGAAAILIHARVATKRHGGSPQWEVLARVKAERAIPVIGNGGVEEASDALRMMASTGVDGVVVGRAAIGNPWIFDATVHQVEGKPYIPPSQCEIRGVIEEHFDALVVLKVKEMLYRRRHHRSAEHATVMQFRGHLAQYLGGRPGGGGFGAD